MNLPNKSLKENEAMEKVDEKRDDSDEEVIAIGNFITGEVTILKHIYYKCTGCALCCIENKIPLTEREIAKLEEMEDFDISSALESFVPILIPSGIKSEKYRVKAYVIKKKPFSHECYFLDEKKLCKIHSLKPFACKIYPFSLRPYDDESVKILIHPESVCKFIFEAEEQESNTEQVVKEILAVIVSNMKEISEFKKKVNLHSF